jgi:hypothetical protein
MVHSSLLPAARKHGKPVERSLRFAPAVVARPAMLTLFVGKAATCYTLVDIGSEFAGTRGFQLDKLHATEPEVYHVLVEEDGHARCDCIGHEAHGHCKHGDAIQELAARGELPAPAAVKLHDGHCPGCSDFGSEFKGNERVGPCRVCKGDPKALKAAAAETAAA